tara:strand:- start:259 stop:522 length:264 start_codon:yes stop_codon:yes gene_type:complete
MKTNEIKKGMKIKTNQLGLLVEGEMADNKRGNIRYIYTKASSVGMFDEYGSVYAWNIIYVFDEEKDEWVDVELTPKQQKNKNIGYIL